jgi:hypothetical protein
MWLTKHSVNASLFPLGVDNQFHEGEEVQISGMVVDYDNADHMWQTHVCCSFNISRDAVTY